MKNENITRPYMTTTNARLMRTGVIYPFHVSHLNSMPVQIRQLLWNFKILQERQKKIGNLFILKDFYLILKDQKQITFYKTNDSIGDFEISIFGLLIFSDIFSTKWRLIIEQFWLKIRETQHYYVLYIFCFL